VIKIMDRSKLVERLMATFRGELEEHVRTINEGLLALEKDPGGPGRADWFKTLLRVAHSLKGAARSVGVAPIEEACHRVEEILTAARDGRCTLEAPWFALLFATADAIEEAGMRLREQQELADSPLSRLLPQLESAAAGNLPTALPPSRAASSPKGQAPPPSPPAAPAPSPTASRPTPRPTEPSAGPSASLAGTEPEQRPPAAAPSGGSEPERPALGSAFVRIPAEKLDAMLSRSGELLVARRGVELRAGELASIRESVTRWRSEWQGAEKVLVKLLPRDSNGAGDVLGAPPSRQATEVLGQVGDHLARLERDLDRFVATIGAGARQLERAAVQLDDEVRRVRMLPFAEACQGLERTARDVAQAEQKRVELVVVGGDVELDRSVLEGLRDPLSHLVRNAVDHGIETPEQRRAAGKPALGRVTVAAALRGTQVEVSVSDDGSGLDLDAVRAEAKRRGMSEWSDPHDLVDLIFMPGFSTTRIVTNVSGRGLGLDVVKSRVETLHGSVELTVDPGRGTRFTLSVPLTLTTLRALLVEAGGQTFALASASVPKLVRIDPREVRTLEGRAVLLRDGAALPVVELAGVLGLAPCEPTAASVSASASALAPGKRPGLIVASGDRSVAFLVDELVAEHEIMVKSLGDRIRRLRHVLGATILPNGRIAPVLNPANLVRTALARLPAAIPTAATTTAAARALSNNSSPAPVRKRLLVVDDSVTTRTLEKSILEAAGYEVLTAVDGADGWRLIQEQGADLVVSDIEMPHMDGFALTETIRRSTRFAELPVVLLTARSSERDRSRGAEVGADAYIVKSGFDQNDLIKTINQLL
jgi:two-component system chemotaxis sensor kinase CheA